MGTLRGKVALVTGAGSGIGLATAVCFAQEGAKLVLVGHNEQALRASLPTIAADCVAHVVAAVTQPEDNERTIAVAADRFGGLDIFVANAGVEGAAAAIEDYPLDVFDRVMAVNVRGVFLGLKCAIPMLRKRGGGSVVVASSIGGIKARGQGNSAYIASKHAEIGLMRNAAVECAAHGIRVNCVLPGPTDTRMMHNIEENRSPGAPERARDAILSGMPLRRYGTAEEVANLMLFLASDEASVCTGGVYVADGGCPLSRVLMARFGVPRDAGYQFQPLRRST